MRRLTSLLCVVAVCMTCSAQDITRAEIERRQAEYEKKTKPDQEAYLKLHPTELPDLVTSEILKELKPPPKVEIGKGDTAQQRAAKRALEAGLESFVAMLDRMKSGNFSGTSSYQQMIEVSKVCCEVLPTAYDSPTEQLAWMEYLLQLVWYVEKFALLRTRAGIESPEVISMLRMQRNRSEIDVLKLREKSKK